MPILEGIYDASAKGNYKDMEELIKKAVDAGEHPNDIGHSDEIR